MAYHGTLVLSLFPPALLVRGGSPPYLGCKASSRLDETSLAFSLHLSINILHLKLSVCPHSHT